jgi:protein SCO1/2
MEARTILSLCRWATSAAVRSLARRTFGSGTAWAVPLAAALMVAAPLPPAEAAPSGAAARAAAAGTMAVPTMAAPAAPAQARPAPDTARAVTAAPAIPGPLHVPDVTLVDQDGRKVRFWSDLVAGKVVAVSFVFTHCATICPPIGANFGKLRQLLGSRAGTSVQLISVSVDPVSDTPERLKAWAAKFGAGPGWTLLTGPKPEVDRLLRALQSYTPNFSDHSPLILLGNAATGVWERASGLAPAAEIAAQLARLGSPPAAPRPAAP